MPKIEGFVAPRAAPVARSHWNYAAWVMAALLALVLGMFALLEPIALDLKPGDAHVRSVGAFSWQSASSVFVFPGEHKLHAEREGYLPTEITVKVGGPQPARALIHLVKLPGKLEVDTGGVSAEISADGALLGQVPGVVDVPAGKRTLTFRAARHLDQIERVDIKGGGERQQLTVKLKPNLRGGEHQLGSVRRRHRSRWQGRGCRHPRSSSSMPASVACRWPLRACASGTRAWW